MSPNSGGPNNTVRWSSDASFEAMTSTDHEIIADTTERYEVVSSLKSFEVGDLGEKSLRDEFERM